MHLLIILILTIKKYVIKNNKTLNNEYLQNLIKHTKLNKENYKLINDCLDNYLYTINNTSNFTLLNKINKINKFNNLNFDNDKSTFFYNLDFFIDTPFIDINDLLNYYEIDLDNNLYGLYLYLGLFNSLTEYTNETISCNNDDEFNNKFKMLFNKSINDSCNNKVSSILYFV